MKLLKKVACLVFPLVIFIAGYIPYSFINSQFIVNWFGCGCNPGFNANDFTKLFWIVFSICVTVISFFVSRQHLSKVWMRAIYVIAILAVTLGLSVPFCLSMMWK